MPSRVDLYSGISKMLLAAGCTTVLRGIWEPEDGALPGTAYPVAAVFEEPEQIEAHNFPFKISGTFVVWLFVETGVVASDVLGGGEARYKLLDDLHDSILGQFREYFPMFFSNTTTVWPDRFIMNYWYKGKNDSTAMAELQIRYNLNGAGAPQQ